MLHLGYSCVFTRVPGLSTSILVDHIARHSTLVETIQDTEWSSAKPFKDIPGPKALPLIGNTWRFMPYIGKCNDIFRAVKTSNPRYFTMCDMCTANCQYTHFRQPTL